jgi:hypothetical protein
VSQLRSRLTYANVASSIALFLAVSGGTAYAVATIGTSDIRNHAVTGSKIDGNAVTPSKIAAGAVRSSEVKDGSLRAADFASGQLPTGPAGPAGATGPAGPAGANIAGVISSGGTLIYGKGVTAVSVAGPGVYVVSFNTNVNQCPAVASVGGYQVGGLTENGANGGMVSVQPNGNANSTASSQITFVTRNTAGASSSQPFHFAVFC